MVRETELSTNDFIYPLIEIPTHKDEGGSGSDLILTYFAQEAAKLLSTQ